MKKIGDLTMVLILIVVTAGINILVYSMTYLKEPVFLTHMYAMEQQEDILLKFYYITNAEEQKTPMTLFFPEWEQGQNLCRIWENTTVDTYGIYTLKELQVNISFLEELQTPITLTQMQVRWSDNTKTLTNIGTIAFFPHQQHEHITFIKNDEYGCTIQSKQAMTLEQLQIPIQESISEYVSILGERETTLEFPIQMQQQEQMTIEIMLQIPERNPLQYVVMDSIAVLTVISEQGEQTQMILPNQITHTPEWNIANIYSILYEKEAT